MRQGSFDGGGRAPKHASTAVLPSQGIEAKVVLWWRSARKDLEEGVSIGRTRERCRLTSTRRVIT
jgi:hypothetical protein